MAQAQLLERGQRAPVIGARLYFAGASAVGKSTVASSLREVLGLPVHEVEAEECWGEPPGRERQECFAITFLEKMDKGYGIYTNHLASVYGYTVAMGAGEDLAEEIRAMLAIRGDWVIVLTASRDEIARRIEARLSREPRRSRNIVEEELDLHVRAQRAIIELAVDLGYPVLDTTGRSLDEVIRDVLGVMRSKGWVP